jgi:hypothetical protein
MDSIKIPARGLVYRLAVKVCIRGVWDNGYSDLTLRSAFCRPYATSFNILSSFSLYSHYMFRPNWPSSGSLVVVMTEFAEAFRGFSSVLADKCRNKTRLGQDHFIPHHFQFFINQPDYHSKLHTAIQRRMKPHKKQRHRDEQ